MVIWIDIRKRDDKVSDKEEINSLEKKINKLSSEYHNGLLNIVDKKSGVWHKINKQLQDIIVLTSIYRGMRLNEAKSQLEKAFTPRIKDMLSKSQMREEDEE